MLACTLLHFLLSYSTVLDSPVVWFAVISAASVSIKNNPIRT